LETLTGRLLHALTTRSTDAPTDTQLKVRRPDSLPGRIYLTGGGSLLPDLAQALTSLEIAPSISFRQSLEIAPLGPRLGVRTPGHLALLDAPPHPTSELLAPALSLVTCLE
jgi:hypothetical protein